MSSSISTTQLDRVAQQKQLAARQQASAQGPAQGAAFARLLSLACDEDTDLDAQLRQGGKRLDLSDSAEASHTGPAAKTRRKAAQTDDDAALDEAQGTSPTAVANAQLLALLERASQGGGSDSSDAASGATAAVGTEADKPDANTSAPDAPDLATAADGLPSNRPDGTPPTTTELASLLTRGRPDGTRAEGTQPPETLQAENAGPAQPHAAPGRAVSELARLLGAAQSHGGGSGSGQSPLHAATGGTDTPATGNAAAPTDITTAPGASVGASHMARVGAPGAPGARLSAEAGAGDGAAASETVTGAATTPMRVAGGHAADTGGQPQGGPGGDALTGADRQDTAAAEPQAAAGESWQQPWQEAMEQLNHQISYWMGQGVRQANLRVGNGSAQAMDVKLSLKNGKAEIEFRTDHEQARSAIAQGGAEVLRELLAQSGVDLGRVSVGAQGSGERQSQAEQPGQRGGPAAASALAGAGPDVAASTGLSPRTQSSSGLDLYV